MKSKAEQADPGVIQVYRVKHRQQHTKIKNMLPIILKVRLKKGSEPVLVNYITMRERYTNMLLEYYEKKVLLRPAGDKAYFSVHPDCEQEYIEPKDLLQQVKQEELSPLRQRPKKDSRDSRDVRDVRDSKTIKEGRNPQSIVNKEEKEYR